MILKITILDTEQILKGELTVGKGKFLKSFTPAKSWLHEVYFYAFYCTFFMMWKFGFVSEIHTTPIFK